MSINKKIFASLTVLSIMSALAACSSGNLPSSVAVNSTTNFSSANQSDIKVAQLVKSLAPNGESVFIADAGNGEKTGGTFAMKINYGDGKAFDTKASQSGVANKTVAANLTNFEVYLIDKLAGGPVPSGDISALISAANVAGRGPFIVSKNGLLVNGGTQVIVFKNVKATPASNRYYVAVAPRDGTNAYIGKLNAPATNGLFPSSGNFFYVTDGGGPATADIGSTFVGAAPGYTIIAADQPQLTVTVNLADAVGAQVQADVTVNNGAPADPAAVGAF